MSYILEALKKADAERERGAVPDLHAQPVQLAPAYEDEAPRSPKPWLWLVAGVAIALLAVLAWRLGGGDDHAPPAGVAAVPPAPAIGLAAPAAPAPVAPPAPPERVEAEPPPLPAPRPAPPRARPEPRPPAATAPVPPAAPASGPASSTAAKASTKAAPPASRAPPLAELPEDFRRQVPAMTIGGSVYSPQPANRMVIINGQVFREGDPVTPGLLLEQIGPKAAVFSLRGQRFEMPF